MDKAAATAITANLHLGEVCTNGTRVFVHNKVKDKFTDYLLNKVAKFAREIHLINKQEWGY